MVTVSSNPCGILICTRLALRPAAPPPHASSADSIRHKTRTHKSLCRFESVIARRHTNRSRGWDGDHRRWVRNIIQHLTTHHSAIHSPLGPRNHQRARLLETYHKPPHQLPNTSFAMSSNPARRPARTTADQLPGRIAMTLGRALDPALAYSLLRNGIAGKVLQTIGLKRIITLPLVTRVGVNSDFIGAGLLDKPGNMLLTMSAITALRHVRSGPLQHLIIPSLTFFVCLHRRSGGPTSNPTAKCLSPWEPLSRATTLLSPSSTRSSLSTASLAARPTPWLPVGCNTLGCWLSS